MQVDLKALHELALPTLTPKDGVGLYVVDEIGRCARTHAQPQTNTDTQTHRHTFTRARAHTHKPQVLTGRTDTHRDSMELFSARFKSAVRGLVDHCRNTAGATLLATVPSLPASGSYSGKLAFLAELIQTDSPVVVTQANRDQLVSSLESQLLPSSWALAVVKQTTTCANK